MDCEVQNDDKLGMELAEMEDNDVQPVLHKPQKHDAKFPRSSKHGLKQNVPLGIQNKKFEILLRGSPHKRSSSSQETRTAGEKGKSRSHHHSSKKQRVSSSKNEVSMGSKNPSNLYQ